MTSASFWPYPDLQSMDPTIFFSLCLTPFMSLLPLTSLHCRAYHYNLTIAFSCKPVTYYSSILFVRQINPVLQVLCTRWSAECGWKTHTWSCCWSHAKSGILELLTNLHFSCPFTYSFSLCVFHTLLSPQAFNSSFPSLLSSEDLASYFLEKT